MRFTAAAAVLLAAVAAGPATAAGASAGVSRPGPAAAPLPPDAGHDVLPVPGGVPRPSAGPSAGPSAAPSEAQSTPPVPSGLPSAIEPLSPYLPQRSCDYREKPGVRAFADLLLRTYPDSGSYGIVNTCLREGHTSEHAEGRAFDWKVSVSNSRQVGEVHALFDWLFAPDTHGNRYAMARRLGLMYMIWDKQIWGTYAAADGWRPYSCSGTTGCHQDHVHFSFGWAGAWQRTSYWTRSVAPVDYGPCVPAGQRNAPVWTAVNPTPCATPPAPPTPRTDREFIAQNLYLVAVRGDSGSAVSVIQRQLGISADGSFGAGTEAAVRAYQQAHGLPVTGTVAVATWQAFLGAAARRVAGDYTGDGRADLAVWRPSTGVWWVRGTAEVHWGQPGDIPVPGDYDGDGRTDRAVWRPSTGSWWVPGRNPVHWGEPEDIPVPADYTGDGRTDLALWRPSTGVWWVYGRTATHWGEPGDIPLPADLTGDGRAEELIYRPASSTWWRSGAPARTFGAPSDVPVVADYTGDGKAELATWRPPGGTWQVDGQPGVAWGQSGDQPVPADLGGDGRAEYLIWRPSTGIWWPRGAATVPWGVRGDVPVGVPAAVRCWVGPC